MALQPLQFSTILDCVLHRGNPDCGGRLIREENVFPLCSVPMEFLQGLTFVTAQGSPIRQLDFFSVPLNRGPNSLVFHCGNRLKLACSISGLPLTTPEHEGIFGMIDHFISDWKEGLVP
jgi:hypothetical protein